MNELNKVTRLEVIDHTPCSRCGGTGRVKTWTDSAAGQSIAFDKECDGCAGTGTPGRELMFWDAYKEVSMSLQDDGKTLKLFINKREDNVN